MKNNPATKLQRYTGDGLQDLVFLVGIFLFISIMIIGLFPGEDIGFVINREYFIYGAMTVPVVAAIYFIIIGFRRKRFADSSMIGSSIRKKMALAFVFVALLPSLPIVITSNYFIHQTMSHILDEKKGVVGAGPPLLTGAPLENQYRSMERDVRALGLMMRSGPRSEGFIRAFYGEKGLDVIFLKSRQSAGGIRWEAGPLKDGVESRLAGFYGTAPFSREGRVDSVLIGEKNYIAGACREGNTAVVLYESFAPEPLASGPEMSPPPDLSRLENVIMQFKTRAGIFFFILSILIMAISVILGLYLSKSITRPVLELSDAAKKIASGDFSVVIERDSEDELGLLYGSFNSMVQELDRNRKTTYQKQKLEAWRDMARRLVHEIKNPLTPIRLSAERIRKRYLEDHPDIRDVLMSGTETIIEEVDVLMEILSEFTKFARLPEMKPSEADINEIVENCIYGFSSLDRVTFHLDLSPLAPAWIDKVLIRQALMNLIQNAIDAIEHTGTITVVTEPLDTPAGPIIRIRVRDDGIGIREGDIEGIFSPGYSTKPQGSGLGLAIVEKILMEHGGRITCDSSPGQGTEFAMDIPVKSEEDYSDGQDSDSR